MTPYDIVLAERSSDGRMVGHRPDCPMVERFRATGRPMITMLKCERPPPPDVVLHYGCWGLEAP